MAHALLRSGPKSERGDAMEDRTMKRFSSLTMALPALLGLWVVLSGADQGCYLVQEECGDLDEAACLERADCRPIYSELLYDQVGLRCGPEDGARCINPEPVFEGCEERPTCAGLDEGGCLSEPSCQAVYGYPDEYWLLDGMNTRCGATRCLEPPEVFLECVEAGADFCAGLDEGECLRRPACEPEYDDPGCDGDRCWDGMPFYSGCHLRGGSECRTDSDCYAYYGPAEDGAPSPACYNWYMTCEAGRCVEHCEEPVGCQSDADCLAGERCEVRCGNGWCEGACVPVGEDCQVTGCPVGQVCEVMCYDCAPGTDCEAGCFGTCVPEAVGCQSDADCPSGEICQLMPCDCMEGDPDCLDRCREVGGVCVPQTPICYGDQDCPEGFYCAGDFCDPAMCGGMCVPREPGCGEDVQCAPGERCEVQCGNGWCQGVCVPAEELAWVEFEPMQCVETPWEADLAARPELYMGCMIDCCPECDCLGGVDELCVLGTFLADLGVVAQDLRHVRYGVAVCEACGVCPRGDAFYALVPGRDVELLLRLGFEAYLVH